MHEKWCKYKVQQWNNSEAAVVRKYFTCYYFHQQPGLLSKSKHLLTSPLLNQP